MWASTSENVPSAKIQISHRILEFLDSFAIQSFLMWTKKSLIRAIWSESLLSACKWSHFGSWPTHNALRKLHRLIWVYMHMQTCREAQIFFILISLWRRLGIWLRSSKRVLAVSLNKFSSETIHSFIHSIHAFTKTYLYNFDPQKTHFYIVKLWFTGVYIIFLISVQRTDCGYSLEPPQRGGSNEYPQSMFGAEIWKLS